MTIVHGYLQSIWQKGGGENINFDLSINRLNQEISTRVQAHSKHFCVYQEGKYSWKIITNTN